MRENMPGRGYSQGVGSVKDGAVSTQRPDVDMGPRITKYKTKARGVDGKQHDVTVNTFDAVWAAGRFRSNIRDMGYDHETGYRLGDTRQRQEARPLIGFNRPAREEPYLRALQGFFAVYTDRLSDADQEALRLVGIGGSVRQIAKELGRDESTVREARKRAIKHLLDTSFDGSTKALARELRFQLKAQGLEHFLPGWVN